MKELKGGLHTVRDALYMSKRVAEPCVEESDYYRAVVKALAIIDAILEAVPDNTDILGWPYPHDVKDEVQERNLGRYYQAAALLATITKEPK